jgi:hypothetical protein
MRGVAIGLSLILFLAPVWAQEGVAPALWWVMPAAIAGVRPSHLCPPITLGMRKLLCSSQKL